MVGTQIDEAAQVALRAITLFEEMLVRWPNELEAYGLSSPRAWEKLKKRLQTLKNDHYMKLSWHEELGDLTTDDPYCWYEVRVSPYLPCVRVGESSGSGMEMVCGCVQLLLGWLNNWSDLSYSQAGKAIRRCLPLPITNEELRELKLAVLSEWYILTAVVQAEASAEDIVDAAEVASTVSCEEIERWSSDRLSFLTGPTVCLYPSIGKPQSETAEGQSFVRKRTVQLPRFHPRLGSDQISLSALYELVDTEGFPKAVSRTSKSRTYLYFDELALVAYFEDRGFYVDSN